jgi:ATP-dependent Lon protease
LYFFSYIYIKKNITKPAERGKKLPQVFYCLVGKPGVGKTEIVKQIAKAYQRQLEIIGMAGLTDPAILNGRERAYKSSRWGRIMDAFVERKAQATIKLTDLEADLAKLQAKTVKTELEKTKTAELVEEIKK